LMAINKQDLAPEAAGRLLAAHPGSVAISASKGVGIDALLLALGDRIRSLAVVHELIVPYERGDILDLLHREGEVMSESYEDRQVRVRARLERSSLGRLKEFLAGADDRI
jgi:GTPase